MGYWFCWFCLQDAFLFLLIVWCLALESRIERLEKYNGLKMEQKK